MCDQPGRKKLYWMEIKDARNMRLLLGNICVHARIRAHVLSPSLVIPQAFPSGSHGRLEIKPCWESYHKAICQSAVLKGRLLGCD